MKTKYRKYTNRYMKYLRILHHNHQGIPSRTKLCWGYWKGKADGSWKGKQFKHKVFIQSKSTVELTCDFSLSL